MLGHSPFYRETIKSITAIFGTVFSDLKIVRTVKSSTQQIKVPLTYASKDKAFIRQEVDPNTNHAVARVFPAMAFQMLGLNYNPARMLSQTLAFNCGGTKVSMPVPYDIHYELYIGSTNIEDGLECLEQILPFFAPSYTITSNDWPTMGIKKDVPIVLNSVNFTDNTPDSDFVTDRILEWTLSFTAQTYIFGPSSIAGGPIKTVIDNIFDMNTNGKIREIDVAVNPTTANSTDAYTLTTTIK